MRDGVGSHNTVKSVEIAMQVVETLKDKGGMGVTEIAEEMGLPKSTSHRHLKTLADKGYLVKDGTTYRTGLRFLEIGEAARTRLPGSEIIRPKVKKIAIETGEKAQFFVEEHGKAVYVYQETGDQAVELEFGVGERVPLHSTAGGKAILSKWSDDRIEKYVETCDFTEITSYTITDPDELFDEIERTRERGYGLNKEEHYEGFIAVGVPVLGKSATVLGALSVGGPINRMKGDRLENEILTLLLGVSNELELNLRYS
ncbi:IclR family transcriptional regulator [Natronorarus salvus]|uniref:IclR family transcriptional regulator n=1 Tax=Natronorarus salvus TaxID=3117733 RepID=UPI002F266C05